MKSKALHEKALGLAKRYIEAEKELLTLLMEMQEKRAFLDLGYTGIFTYCLQALKFSESQAHYFSSVAKKSLEVPELKKAIDDGLLNLSKARRIAPVITPATQAAWIEKASTLSQRELELEVAAVNPRSVRERIQAVGPSRHEVRLGVSEETRKKLERVKDLLKTTSLEEVLDQVLDLYLEKKDPVRKAERATFLRKVKPGTKAIPAQVKHEVYLRDRGQCQICGSTRYSELHHKIPRARGGAHTAQNLITLCWAHHRMWHFPGPRFGHGERVEASGPGRLDGAGRALTRLGRKDP